MFLLGTNLCVAYLRGKNTLVRSRVLAQPLASLHLCSPVTAELRFGAANSGNPVNESVKVESFIAHFNSLTFDDAATHEYAHIRLNLTQRGLLISEMDMLIAAIAISRNLTLVSHNTPEFSRVPGLQVVDWEIP
jgi:tRNA(fMet)-specific endonuclease VapC